MKKLLIGCWLLIMLFYNITFAGGGLTHMYVAHTAINSITNSQLRNLLLDNMDAYLVGAYYPDSGYVKGNHYGEDSHWDPFIFAFADYIRETYPDPARSNPKLVAFLFGIAAHSVADIIMHWTFYPEVRDHDFPGDKSWEHAHQWADPGIDLLTNIDENQWLTQPKRWWVPVKDLVAVYHRMGKDQYTAEEIIRGNAVLSLTGTGERIIAAPAYPYLRWKMPWTARHYTNDPIGGLQIDEAHVAAYQMLLWDRLTTKNPASVPSPVSPNRKLNEAETPILKFAEDAIAKGTIMVGYQTNADGSVEYASPVITKIEAFKKLLSELKAKILGES